MSSGTTFTFLRLQNGGEGIAEIVGDDMGSLRLIDDEPVTSTPTKAAIRQAYFCTVKMTFRKSASLEELPTMISKSPGSTT